MRKSKAECERLAAGFKYEIDISGGLIITGLKDAYTDEVVIPEGVDGIKALAFDGQTRIKRVVLPKSIKKIGEFAFRGCSRLVACEMRGFSTSYALNEGVFNNCTSLKSITLPEGITFVPKNFFAGCEALTDIKLPGTCVTIADGAFFRCEAIKGISLPKGLLAIGRQAFFCCKSLKEIKLPEGITKVGEQAFDKTALAEVTLPESLTEIGKSAFPDDCEVKREKKKKAQQAHPSAVRGAEQGGAQKVAAVSASAAKATVRKTADSAAVRVDDSRILESFIYKRGANGGIILQKLKNEGVSVFKEMKSRGNLLVIPEGVTEIADSAFWVGPLSEGRAATFLEKLTALVLPSTLKRIGDSAFSNCGDIGELVLPEGLEYIGNCAFFDVKIKRAVIPSTVKEIGSSAFDGSHLEEMVIKEGVRKMGAWCLANNRLASLTLPDSLEEIADFTFLGSPELTELTVGRGVKKVSARAFAGIKQMGGGENAKKAALGRVTFLCPKGWRGSDTKLSSVDWDTALATPESAARAVLKSLSAFGSTFSSAPSPYIERK